MTGSSPPSPRGGVVLAGGRSTRMGAAKAGLEWHGSTLLRRTVGIVGRAVDGPVVVVRASGQRLPDLPLGTLVVDDPREDKGPVQGIAAGLTALLGRAESAFVASTDLPFLHPAFVTRVLRALDGPDGPDVALPVAHGYQQPLAAGYRTGLGELASRLVEQDRLRPAFLFEACAVLRLDEAALRADPVLAALDPELDSLLNVNTPADYATACARLAPTVAVRLVGAPGAPDLSGGPRLGPAATIREAADAVRLPVGRTVAAALNGAPVTDVTTPLVAGDEVSFLVAG
ncbi:molybdenum cofactor guanylyltransferase [Frankia sp. AgB1.8]|uniref:molybdenum cofactor guanylyltransferase n=1 Tax=Frankia sp. AgB1.8 TaxID=2792839 RepID=UPI001934B1EB|nr:molybdenum cofactor guanylyltransferase [Frankia sp. AgB1.8]MBL7617712.1 molybdenum cofactor guanylyltransferase [Frankia sp. AgB1.8]